MSDREVVLDEPVVMNEKSEALRHAVERAEAAEAELAKMKAQGASADHRSAETPPPHSDMKEHDDIDAGVEEMRKDSMMAHLIDSLDAGKDIGHYGRLVFAMVARHFLTHEDVVRRLTQDRDFSDEQAEVMLRQVEERDYNPPKRERIVEWQAQQEFPILPNADDPDCGNLYRNLKFPEKMYKHIEQYQEEKMHAEE